MAGSSQGRPLNRMAKARRHFFIRSGARTALPPNAGAARGARGARGRCRNLIGRTLVQARSDLGAAAHSAHAASRSCGVIDVNRGCAASCRAARWHWCLATNRRMLRSRCRYGADTVQIRCRYGADAAAALCEGGSLLAATVPVSKKMMATQTFPRRPASARASTVTPTTPPLR